MKAICIDIGNSRSKLALVENYEVLEKFYFQENEFEKIVENWWQVHRIDYAIVSNVTNFDVNKFEVLTRLKKIYFIDELLRLPFESKYETPTTLGNDRKAAIAAVQKLFPTQNNLVLTMGTCITYNFLSKENIFLGGAISPGLHMRIKAMNHFTQKLPLVEIPEHINYIGSNTIQSLQSGAVNGVINEIEGFVEMYRKDYDKLNVILTGGDTAYFSTRLKCRIFADENLIFKGLYALLLFQVQ